jgi:hypothetical protein
VNVLKPHLQTTIQTLLEANASQREIERVTGIDRKTIRAYQKRFATAAPANSPGVATDCHAVTTEGENKSNMPAHATQTPPLGVANVRRSSGYGCALRLDWGRLGGLLGHAGFILTL